MEPDEQGRFGFNVQVIEYFSRNLSVTMFVVKGSRRRIFYGRERYLLSAASYKDNRCIFLGRCRYQFAGHCIKDRSGNAGKSFIL